MMPENISLQIRALADGYAHGRLRPTHVAEEVFRRIRQVSGNPIWIHLLEKAQVLERARELEAIPPAERPPLYGIPFAVKDNIDVAGLPTTAGCPAFAYTARRSAAVVERLLAAGAMLIGKTNLDQFATGLVGTRSPYGACHSVFDVRYISGGSSSGSAVAVAAGLVSFALGTDTAGSGRVPAAFNNLIGLKPTRGRLPASGVVPACRSLDCVSVFALDALDADAVLRAAQGYDPSDPYSREAADAAAPWLDAPRIGVPPLEQLEFFGDAETPAAFARSVDSLSRAGARVVDVDWTPFRASAELLYSGPWVAEREAAVGEFRAQHADQMDPTVSRIISGGAALTAVEAFRGQYRLQEWMAAARSQWDKMDVLLLPTAGTTYTIEQIQADPVRLNTNLGHYTNFVNLMDLAAVAAPAGFLPSGLPFGVTFLGRAFTDRALLAIANRFHRQQRLPLGATTISSADLPDLLDAPPGCVAVAVVGAHLSGQPLNGQLLERGAVLARTCRTAAEYRLYELPNSTPRKPALMFDPGFSGPGIEVEVWNLPVEHFGSFVSLVPPPLGIGKVQLEDGSQVCGFICEPRGIAGAREITRYGGWRKWLEV
jgi:allophanate hydrolase